jgi:glycosyltransferase involved in cell wall biosynthesis
MCLSFRKDLTPSTAYDDPRGLTGSDYGCLRIAEELSALGHSVTIHTVSNDTQHGAIQIKPLDAPIEADVVLSINEPDLLRAAPTGSKRIVWNCLNDVSFCRVGFEEHVDLFLSPSNAHIEQFMTNPAWREVERTVEFPNGKARFTPDPSKWVVLPLGCDPERFEDVAECEYCGNGAGNPDECDYHLPSKIPHRVIYASSPDRGLHHLLGAWPTIKRAVPDATLHVFYRLDPFLRGFDQTPWFPPIEPNRKRANYIEECLRRFRECGGMGVTLRDSVSRRTIEREMAQACVLAYPCDTIAWSEGFSCTTLECCAARACPVVSDCDAMGEIYYALGPVPREPGWVKAWTERVIEALKVESVRDEQNERAYKLASKLTWKNYAEKLMKEIETRWPQQNIPEPRSSNPSAPA